MREQIGSVEIRRTRVYALDPSVEEAGQQTVLVEPGHYPVYRDGISTYWQMTGVLNHSQYRLGDGLVALNPDRDVRSDDEVIFYSRRYGPDEWKNLMEEFAAMPSPPLVFSIGCGRAWPWEERA